MILLLDYERSHNTAKLDFSTKLAHLSSSNCLACCGKTRTRKIEELLCELIKSRLNYSQASLRMEGGTNPVQSKGKLQFQEILGFHFARHDFGVEESQKLTSCKVLCGGNLIKVIKRRVLNSSQKAEIDQDKTSISMQSRFQFDQHQSSHFWGH